MVETATFTIKIDAFEGPLDLLLSLIEKRKLFINDISLSKVADDYIEHVKGMGEFPIGMTAHFILIASTLLLIKSKSLLPSLNLTEEEQNSIEDLEERLVLHKRFKELAIEIEKIFGREIIFQRNPSKSLPVVFSPEPDITRASMLLSAQSVIHALPKKEVLPKTIVKKMISLEDMIERLTERVESSLKTSFGAFAQTQGKTSHTGARHTVTREERVNIIVSFLAMLELVKQGVVNVSQEHMTDDIEIETKNIGTPQYT